MSKTDFVSDHLLTKAGLFESRELSRKKIHRAFKYIDTNNTGRVTLNEFRELLLLLNFHFPNPVVNEIFELVDRNCNGTIELYEFENFLEASHPPENKIRCDFFLNLAYPSLFIKFHIWNVKSRPLNFTLSSGANNISAYFQFSSNPKMARCVKQEARLLYINFAPVENAAFVDIESTLSSIHCPFILVFHNLDTSWARKPEELNVFKSMNFEGWPNLLSPWEKKLFNEPLETHTVAESAPEKSNKRVLQYYNHCKHCPHEEAWYLHVHRIMEDEKYSTASRILTYMIMLLIAISTLAYVFQTLPAWEHWRIWHSLEAAISIVFTIEFLLRISSCRSVRLYMSDFMNIVDFCAVIPYWIELASSGKMQPALLRVVRVIRLLRLVRLVKSRSLQEILTIYRLTFEESSQWLIMFMYLGFVLSVVVASFFFIFEVGNEKIFGSCNVLNEDDFCQNSTVEFLYDNSITNLTSREDCMNSCADFSISGCCSFNQISGMCQFFNSSVFTNSTNSSIPDYTGLCVKEKINIRQDSSESPFFNIPISLWFTYVTMTMVGYGEISPVSYGGQLVSVVGTICGPIFLALPLIIVGTHFTMSIYHNRISKLTAEASKSATVINILKMVNEVVGTQLFKPKDQLPFLSSDINLASKQKIENLLLFDSGWFYLPFATVDTAGIIRLSQYKLYVLFAIFGHKIKKIMHRRKKQSEDLRRALEILKQRSRSSSKKRTIKLVDYSDAEDNKHNDVAWPKGSSSVNFLGRISSDSPIVRSRVHTRQPSRGTAVSFMGSETQSWGSHRRLAEYCSFGELKMNELQDESITRNDYDSPSASMAAITSFKPYKPNYQVVDEEKIEQINRGYLV